MYNAHRANLENMIGNDETVGSIALRLHGRIIVLRLRLRDPFVGCWKMRVGLVQHRLALLREEVDSEEVRYWQKTTFLT